MNTTILGHFELVGFGNLFFVLFCGMAHSVFGGECPFFSGRKEEVTKVSSLSLNPFVNDSEK